MNSLQQRIKFEQKYANAESYAKKMEAIERNTFWYDQTIKKDKQNSLKLSTKRTKEEIRMTLEELKIARRTRLSELYTSEAQLYQEYLAQSGLAIRKERF